VLACSRLIRRIVHWATLPTETVRTHSESVGFRFSDAANGAEAFLEFVDAAFGIDKLRESREKRMRVGGDANGDYAMFTPSMSSFFSEVFVERVMKRLPVVMSTKTTGLYFG